MKLSELETMIRKVVQEEFKVSAKKYIRAYVPIVMKEVVDDLVEARLNEIVNTSNKRPLKESVKAGYEEWPTLGGGIATTTRSPQMNRSKLATLLGYGDTASTVNTIDTMITESGTPVAIPQDTIPKDLVQALNKDYRKFMKAVDGHRGAGASIPLGTPIG